MLFADCGGFLVKTAAEAAAAEVMLMKAVKVECILGGLVSYMIVNKVIYEI